MDTHDRRAGTVAGGDLLQRQRIGDGAGLGPAIGLRHQHAEKAEFAHLPQFFTRETALTIPFRSPRGQPLAGEIAGHVADLPLGFGEDHDLSLSNAMAVASPPPMQMAAMPRRKSYCSSAESSVTRMRAPDAPMGWPSAQAPP